jgi:glycosyltransferase involved in cell wall biosynthesis
MISVIVPIFNAEKTLERCLNSIKNQTYRDLEIILVNDGSTDNSLNICNKFSENDGRFLIINQSNSGAGEARNAGLRKASGAYIGFVDSDDLVMPEMYETLIKNIKDRKAEISIIQLRHLYENDEVLNVEYQKPEKGKIDLLIGREALKEALNGINFGTHSVTKLFKKEVFDDCHFPNSSYGEDSNLIIKILLKVEFVVFENTVMYYYIHNKLSSTEKMFNPEMFDIIRVWEKNENEIVKTYPELIPDVHSRVCWAYFSVLDLMIKSDMERNYSETKEIVKFLKDNMLFIVGQSNLTKSRKIAGLGLLVSLEVYKLFTKAKLKTRK